MKNLKHTIMAIASIAMVGTLSFFQVSDMSAQKLERDMKLGTASSVESMILEDSEEDKDDANEGQTEEQTESEATEQAIAEKSSLTEGFAMVTGTADLKAAPSDEAETIGTMSGADSLEVLESTEGWYKVMVNGQSGYVKKELVTLNKTEAETAAKQYDHYKKAKVTSASGLTVRAAGDENSSSVGLVGEGDEVIIVDTQNDYIKILYGSDYSEGYVINSGLDITGEWVTKAEVHTAVKKAAEEKAAAERAEAQRQAQAQAQAQAKTKEQTRLAAMGYSSAETASSNTASTSVSGRGQALVNTAKKYLGVPYVWGGTSPSGFDCSGLVQYVCRQNGISVPRVAASQRGAGVSVSRANLQPGDLVFFGKGGRVTHVGIYVGNGNMIHAPQTGDVVKISSINTSYRVSSYAGAVRVW